MTFSTGWLTDALLTVVIASLVVLGVAGLQPASLEAGRSAAPVSFVDQQNPTGGDRAVTAERTTATQGPVAGRTAAGTPVRVSGASAGAVAVAVADQPDTDSIAVAPVTAPVSPVAAPVRTPAALAAAVPAPVPSTAPALCSGSGWQQRRGAAALASLRPAEPSGYPVTFKPARQGFLGLTEPSEQLIEVYVRDCATETDELLRHVVAHEIGHARDKTALTDDQRSAWLAVRGIPAGAAWQGCDGCTDFATPAGDFAEVYAQWRRGATDNRSELAGAPGPAALEALARQFFGG